MSHWECCHRLQTATRPYPTGCCVELTPFHFPAPMAATDFPELGSLQAEQWDRHQPPAAAQAGDDARSRQLRVPLSSIPRPAAKPTCARIPVVEDELEGPSGCPQPSRPGPVVGVSLPRPWVSSAGERCVLGMMKNLAFWPCSPALPPGPCSAVRGCLTPDGCSQDCTQVCT